MSSENTPLNPDRVKHLEFIQSTISRLAGNSFLLKGWTVTLVAALFALAAKESQQRYSIVALIPAFCFWGLDAYYLRQERLYRAFYDRACPAESTVPVYSMNPNHFAQHVPCWGWTLFTHTLFLFYLPIITAIIFAGAFLSIK